jgi:hypothetical protein
MKKPYKHPYTRISQARLQHSKRFEKVEGKYISHGYVWNPSTKGLYVTSIEINRKYYNRHGPRRKSNSHRSMK